VRGCAKAAGERDRERKREREREREKEKERERERERETQSVWHTLTHTHQNDLSPIPHDLLTSIPHGHTLRYPRSIPYSSCVSLERALLLHHHHHLPAQVHFPTYLALPSLPRGPSCHIRWSLPLFRPMYLYPPYPLARPVSAGQPSVAARRLLFVDTAMPVHQMVGRWICVCVSVCVRERSS
jgi:hypothetical protein